eukprot:m.27655 g.27655  ORF g.27655 m.27655 type:complete len:294 (+) comp7916_c0_seq3:70-951(+)
MSLRLLTWGPDWGVASVEPKCLSVLAYLRFAKITSVTVETTKELYSTALYHQRGLLPPLVFTKNEDGEENEENCISTVPQIIARLRGVANIDSNLSTKDCADAVAIETMLTSMLYPAIQHFLWLDPKNYQDVTRPSYATSLPFPLAAFILPTMVSKARAVTHSNDELEIKQKASQCLETLADLLGSSKYFYGNRPSSIDAIVFGYIGIILRSSLPHAALRLEVNTHPKLVEWFENLEKEYFRDVLRDYNEKIKNSKSGLWYSSTLVKQASYISIAVAAMSFYGLLVLTNRASK